MPELAHPERLLALVGVAVVVALLLRSGRPRLALTRGVIGALLCLALADPATRRGAPALPVVHVVDTSESVPPSSRRATWTALQAELAARTGEVSVVQVDGAARYVPLSGRPGRLPESPLPPSPAGGTALAAGLELAAARLPTTPGGRVVVHTDGWADADSVAAAVSTLRARGLEVRVAPIEVPPPPADLTHLTLPDRATVGATLAGELAVWGGTDGLQTTARVVLEGPDGTVLPPVDVAVDAPSGTAPVLPWEVPLSPDLAPGLWAVRVDAPSLEPLVRGVWVERPPRVLLVRGEARDGAVLQGVLEAEGLQVQAVPGSAPPPLTPDTDLVVLAAPSATGRGALPRDWVTGLGPFVEDGGGLLTVAGPGAYASGGWQDSPLAPLLPVRIDPDGAEKDDSVALLVVLDKSGSMARPAADARSATGMVAGVTDMMVGGRAQGSKIRVASEAAAATMTRLRDHDRIGVLAVDTLPYWSVEMVDASERATAMAQVRRISAGGGGMYVLTALEAAAVAMRAEDAPLRHILLLVDASDAGEQTQDIYGDVRSAVGLARELQAAGITVSVVGIGSTDSRDSPFLRSLTTAGGGRLQLTPDIRAVSALFAQEVERLVGSAVTEQAPVRVQVSGWHPALVGVDMARAPKLHGWADVLARPTARDVLTTPAGTPILAVWQRGLGRVASWTTDDGARWARGWPAWEGSARMWTQLVRSLARDVERADSGLTLTPTDTGVVVQLARTDPDGHPTVVGRPEVTVTVDGEVVPSPELRLSAPGVLTGSVAAAAGARVEVAVAPDDPAAPPIPPLQALVPSSAERGHRGTRDEVLAALEVPAGPPSPAPGPRHPMWPWLVGLAALLLPLDAWARRVPPRAASS